MTLIYLGLQEVILIDLLVHRCKMSIYKGFYWSHKENLI